MYGEGGPGPEEFGVKERLSEEDEILHGIELKVREINEDINKGIKLVNENKRYLEELVESMSYEIGKDIDEQTIADTKQFIIEVEDAIVLYEDIINELTAQRDKFLQTKEQIKGFPDQLAS